MLAMMRERGYAVNKRNRELYRDNGEGEKATRLGGAFVPRGKSHGKLADLCDWHTFATVSQREGERGAAKMKRPRTKRDDPPLIIHF